MAGLGAMPDAAAAQPYALRCEAFMGWFRLWRPEFEYPDNDEVRTGISFREQLPSDGWR